MFDMKDIKMQNAEMGSKCPILDKSPKTLEIQQYDRVQAQQGSNRPLIECNIMNIWLSEGLARSKDKIDWFMNKYTTDFKLNLFTSWPACVLMQYRLC